MCARLVLWTRVVGLETITVNMIISRVRHIVKTICASSYRFHAHNCKERPHIPSEHDCIFDTFLYQIPYRDNNTLPMLQSFIIYCDHSTNSTFIFYYFIYKLPDGYIDIAKAEIIIYLTCPYSLTICNRNRKSMINFIQFPT